MNDFCRFSRDYPYEDLQPQRHRGCRCNALKVYENGTAATLKFLKIGTSKITTVNVQKRNNLVLQCSTASKRCR